MSTSLEPPDQPVEQIGGQALERALAVARQPLGVDDLEALLPFGDHVEHDFGRVLQVGVHDDDRLAGARAMPVVMATWWPKLRDRRMKR